MKILVVGPSWVGDMCMAQVLFKLLKLQHPQATIDVLAPQWSESLLSCMPEVENSLTMPFGHGAFQLRDRIKFGRSLRRYEYDWAIVLPNSWKSALIVRAAKIPKRTGWLGEARYGLLNDYRKLNKKLLPLMVQRFAALADFNLPVRPKESLPVPTLQANQHNAANLIEKFSLRTNMKTLIVCPGAEFGATKIWPANYFASLANEYLAKGWQVWVLGSPNDCEVSAEIQSLITVDAQHFFDLVGQTLLADAVDLLSIADLVVANDSGLMHIASALHRKTLAIYGSTSPEFTPPLGADVLIAQPVDLYCSPCFNRTCKEGHLRCLKDQRPPEIIQKLETLE